MSESIRYAFSSNLAPGWDFSTLIAKAKEHGYDAITLGGFNDSVSSESHDLFLTDSAKLRKQFEESGIAVASLATRIAPTGSRVKDLAQTDHARRLIGYAADLGASCVRLLDPLPQGAQNKQDLIYNYAQWLSPLVDEAAQVGVSILIQNANSLTSAKQMWTLIDHLSHPSLGVAWDQVSAYPETQSVSLPVLNYRLKLLVLRDAAIENNAVSWRNLGEGAMQISQAMLRLKGLGYRGFVSVEYPAQSDPDALLKDSITKLRAWTKPPEPPKPKVAPKPVAKPAAPAPTTSPAVTPTPAT